MIKKVAGGVVLALLLGMLGLWYHSGNLQERIGEFQEREGQLLSDLQRSEDSVNLLWSEMVRADQAVREVQELHRLSKEQIRSLDESLQRELRSNTGLQECLAVDLGDYADSLREYSDSNRGKESSSSSDADPDMP